KEGLYSNNILNLVNTEMASVIRNAIKQVKETKKSIAIKNILYNISNEEQINTNIYLEQANVIENNSEIFLIQFGENLEVVAEQQIFIKNTDISEYSLQRIEELETELKETKTELQNVIEELEASNEELQSANEELMSSNEELQSANEELQSVNEELYTVNTEFQEKNKELTNLNNDITNLLNSIDVGTLFLDKDLNIRKFSKEINRVFKLEDNDIGRSIIAFASNFPEKERQQIINEAKNALDNLESYESEIQDIECNWYLIKVKPFVTSEKSIEGVLITFININNIKQTTQKLKKVEERLSLSLEAGNIAWWEMELPSGNVYFSKNKAIMIGHDPKKFKHYEDFMKIVHPEDRDKAINAMYELLNGVKNLYDCEYRIQNIKGNYQWFHDIGKITYSNGENIIVSGIVKEITENKKLELNLKDAIKKAEIANIYKNQFLANMSHEIRTPMNAIVGFSNLLKNPNLNQNAKLQYSEIIETSSQQLLNLINDIIEISKIEAGELKIVLKNCKLFELFTNIETTYNQIKLKKGKENVSIKLKVPPNFKDLFVKTDPFRLQQILNNLIDNALKFTDNGYVEFGYSIENENLKIFVSDTGIGMPEEKINLVFERFFRIEDKNNQNYQGTGLGLSIVKGIIDLMNGKITIDSKENLGTRVTVMIPIEILNENTKPDNSELQQFNNFNESKIINLLLAEDDHNNIQLFNSIFKELPINVYFAQNGAEAVKIYKEKHIDLVLMDLRMPVKNGFEATREILKLNPNAKIIAQTAYAMAEDKIKCIEFGFCDYISKPIIKEELISKILKWTKN
ncbi:MAG: ATP-binding protein, partial [Bacteroidales bacterium]